ncbi:hypothetical protein [Tardiphaga robiniae]|uniref:hypothetical protein n=1 Tax=Tardiphaga robiniae TaxID=943830 RepID=UPI001112704D|nr:hypothetical protein [Tardiphaga robiniae]
MTDVGVHLKVAPPPVDLRGIHSARCEYIWLLKLVWHRPSFSHQSDMERGSNVGRLNFPDSRLIKNSDQLRPPRRCLGFAVNVTLDPSNRRQERKDRAVLRRGLPGRLRHQSNWLKDHLHTNRLLKIRFIVPQSRQYAMGAGMTRSNCTPP